MQEVFFICEGTCKSRIPLMEFQEGHTKCLKRNCSNYDKPLVKKQRCLGCGDFFSINSKHKCAEYEYKNIQELKA